MDRQPYVLAELDDLSAIFLPLKTTNRIKYTTFNTSKNFLILGATSGGLYLFKREPCVFLQLIPNKEGAITQVAVSHDEKFIAFATIRGIVCALERTPGHTTRHIVSSFEHQNTHITALHWNMDNDEIYIGDDTGKVSVLTVSLFTPKNMFQTPSSPLMQLDSKVVQIDIHGEMLLVSTLTRCYICDTGREIFRQVGHKLRDGEYGACIFSTEESSYSVNTNKNKQYQHTTFSSVNNKTLDYSHMKHLKLYCARPGSRIWEVSIEGVVLSTLHFKQALTLPPTNIIFQHEHVSSQTNGQVNNVNCSSEQSFNFQKLYIVLNKFIFTFKNDGLYIFDPGKADVLLWSNEIKDILDVKCVCDTVYVWCANGRMFALNIIPLDKFLIRLYFRKKYSAVGKLCLKHFDYLKSLPQDSKLHLLADLDKKLNESDSYLVEQIKPLLEIFSKNAQVRQINAQKLTSGIFLVGNNTHYTKIRPSYLSGLNLSRDKSRSHSVSPDRVRKNGNLESQFHGSTSSLPELLDSTNENYDSALFPSPETMQALSYINNTVTDRFNNSTKNIRDKWSFIEDKMKLFGPETYNTTPFDVKTSDYDSNSVSDLENEQTDVKQKHPELNIVEVLDNCRDNSDPVSLLTSILKLNYLYQIKKKANTVDIVIDINITDDYLWENTQDIVPFPFKHYFTMSQCNSMSNMLSNAIKAKSLQQTLNRFIYSVNMEANCSTFFIQFPEDLVKLDLKLSHVFKLFSELLKEKLFEELLGTSTEFYFFSLCVFLDCLKEDLDSKLLTYNQVYHCIRNNDIDKSVRLSVKLSMTDVLFLILKSLLDNVQKGKSFEISELQCQTFFLTYLDRLAQEDTQVDNFVGEFIKLSLENLNSTASINIEKKCNCGYPVPGFYSSVPMFSDIGMLYIEKMWPIQPQKCFELCGNIPYFWRYLIVQYRSENILSALPLIMQIGDFEELENRGGELNITILEVCMRHLIGLKNKNCLKCGSNFDNTRYSVPWSEFGMLCIKLLGSQDTLNLFKKYSAVDIELGSIFYQGVLMSTIMEKHSKGLRKNVVDLLVGKMEKELSTIPVFSEQIKEELSEFDFRKKSLKLKKETLDNQHHWGVKLNVSGPCLACMLPLNSPVLVSEGGLKVFKCTHAFHVVCLRKMDSSCPVCKI